VRRPLFRAAPVVGDLALPQPQRRRTTTSPRPGGAGGSGRGRRRGGTVRIMVLIPEPFLKLRCDQPSGATATSRGLRNVPYDGARLAARWPYGAAHVEGTSGGHASRTSASLCRTGCRGQHGRTGPDQGGAQQNRSRGGTPYGSGSPSTRTTAWSGEVGAASHALQDMFRDAKDDPDRSSFLLPQT